MNDIFSIYRYKPLFCPYCNYEHDACQGVGPDKGKAPERGGISVCVNCMELSLFEEGPSLRKPTDDELEEIMLSDSWPIVVRGRRALKELREREGSEEKREGKNE